jgi:hypothetical protein
MKLSSLAGGGVVACVAGAMIATGTASESQSPWGREIVGSGVFGATVRGAIAASPSGEARFGTSGDARVRTSVFTVSLGAREGQEGALVLTRVGGDRPRPGMYSIAEIGAMGGGDGFHALFVAGPYDRPAGVFRAHSGIVEITASSPAAVSGRFEFEATGFFAADPGADDRAVRASGFFTALPGAPSQLTHVDPD